MSEEQPEKPTYFGKALAGDFEPAYPVKDAFSDLENVLGDMMSITISMPSGSDNGKWRPY
ncbi:hypothetical protein V0M98_11355 [Pseudomonas silesiensis]|uniref:hypothetical protein n=1 Tax=Pseudomonas silesiensis TaxID=1853130 RepID=UPI0030D55BF4